MLSFSLKVTHIWSLKFGLDTVTRRIAWSVPDMSVLRFSLIPVTTPTRVRSTIHHGLDLWLMTVLVLILPSTANHEGPLGSWAVVPLKTPFRNERLTEWDKVKEKKSNNKITSNSCWLGSAGETVFMCRWTTFGQPSPQAFSARSFLDSTKSCDVTERYSQTSRGQRIKRERLGNRLPFSHSV